MSSKSPGIYFFVLFLSIFASYQNCSQVQFSSGVSLPSEAPAALDEASEVAPEATPDTVVPSEIIPKKLVTCPTKIQTYANGTCSAEIHEGKEGSNQGFECNGRGFVDLAYKCDWPSPFIGEQIMQGKVSMTATCGSDGQWAASESFSKSNSCLENGSLYDCYQWVYQGVDGTEYRDNIDSYQVYQSSTSELKTYLESNWCCSKKVQLRDCVNGNDGNKVCKAFCAK